MKFLTKYYKRLKITYIKCAWLIIFMAAIFLPSYVTLESTGDNVFTITVNGTTVGSLGSVEDAENALIDARRVVAAESDQLEMIEVQMSYEGSEVLYGELDPRDQVVAAMADVIRKSKQETMAKAFAVKINQFAVNLASAEEVEILLKAALDKYDETSAYEAKLGLDDSRELTVLTAKVSAISQESALETEEEPVIRNFGVYAALEEIYSSIEPDVEKDFEDYDLGLVSMDFTDHIEVVECYLPINQISDLQTAVSEVTKDLEKEEIYKVVAGDTLSEIAIKTEIPMDQLVALNPKKLDDENSTIHIDDELIITVPQPELSVDRQEVCYYEEDYEAEIQYVYNDEWYTNQTKTLQEPSAGHHNVVALVSYHNDTVSATDILKEEVTYQPVAKIVEKGTKIPPTYIKPIAGGRKSSGFGKRSAPTKGASTYHKGIDWATPVGTAVVASSGGVVTRAGWGKGYGYCVYIKHADGKETRYGHLSKVLVSVGQSVSQGQKIALSGNTGISTGAHLHFEILVNGSQVNPLNYLN